MGPSQARSAAHCRSISRLAVSRWELAADGSGRDGALEVRDIGTNRPPVKLALREPEELFHFYFAADEKTFVVWQCDGTIETYDLRSGKHRRSIQVQEGLPGVLSPDLRWAAACDADPGIVHVYRMDDGAEWLTINRENDYVRIHGIFSR